MLNFNVQTLKNYFMQTILHTADSRGDANHGWLHSKHSFSFASYYNPEKIHFGVLRVLNDDFVAAGMGFGLHPHDNMEIISIPLEGDLAHQDSMGNQTVIQHGDIQVMSAGTGVKHSEMNHNKDKPVKFLQIWVMPNKKNVTPRYDQITLDPKDRINTLQQVLSPNAEDAGVWIHQDAWFHIGKFDLDFTTNYTVKKAGNGMYAFVLYGSFEIAGQTLAERDALGITDFDQFELKALTKDAEILLMEIPMQLS
jgi:redox-sensitive bicupin YhaK (pirin superfamily)